LHWFETLEEASQKVLLIACLSMEKLTGEANEAKKQAVNPHMEIIFRFLPWPD
jgi:hypothetical protein